MIGIDIHHRYFNPIRERAVTAVLTTTLKENIGVGDKIKLYFNACNTYPLDVEVTNIERLRFDELKTRHIVACGYSHMDLLEDDIVKDLGIDPDEGTLVYYIEFDEAGMKIVNDLRKCVLDSDKITTRISEDNICHCTNKEIENNVFYSNTATIDY